MAWKFNKEKVPTIKALQENHSLLALSHEIDDLPQWAREIKLLEDQGMTLNEIRDDPQYKHLYSARSEFIRKDAIIFHKSKLSKHVIFPYELPHHIDLWMQDLESGRHRYDYDLHKTLEFCELGYDLYTNRISNGSLFLRCACVINKSNDSFDLDRCNCCFNLKDVKNYNCLKVILSKNPEHKAKADKLVALIDELLLDDVAGKHRIYSNCIHCGHKNKNEEAVLNLTGDNTKLRHPADITCQSCHRDYCADCLKEHPGVICRGFREGEIDDVYAIACPGCRVPIHRSSGCAFMVCRGKCKRMFCWSCRSLRHEENSVKQHYCLLINSFQANRVWANDPNVRTYITESPL